MEGQESPVLIEQTGPKVIISEKIKSPDYPYNVDVNLHGTAELLRLAGIKEDDIERLTIRVDRRPSFLSRIATRPLIKTSPLGEYSVFTRTMSIYTDSFVWMRDGFIYSAEQALEDPINADHMLKTPSQKKLAKYLQTAPKDRAKRTIHRLANIYMERELNNTLTHEAYHAADHSRSGLGMLISLQDDAKSLFFLLTSQPRNAYLSRGHEKRAFAFQDKEGKKVNLISLSPKNPNSEIKT